MGGSYPKNPPLNPQVRIVVVFAELRCCRGTRAGYVGFDAAAPAQPRTYVISSSGGGAPWAPCVLIPPCVAASCLFFLALRSARFRTTAFPLSLPSLSFFPRPNVIHQAPGHVYSCAFCFGSSYFRLSFWLLDLELLLLAISVVGGEVDCRLALICHTDAGRMDDACCWADSSSLFLDESRFSSISSSRRSQRSSVGGACIF